MPESIAPSAPKVFFGNSDSGGRKQLSKEEQGKLIKDLFHMSKYTHYQRGGMTWSPKELRAATCKRACSGCG